MEDNEYATPTRIHHRYVIRDRQAHSDTRRNLFDNGDSDLSDISPLSRTSSDLLSPVSHKSSPIKLAQFRLHGVSHLSPDHGIITPKMFYGTSSSASHSNGAEMYKQIRESLPKNCKARTSLFLDDLPKNKKRSRSSGNPNESMKQVKKKIKLQPNLSVSIRKPSKSEIRQREMLKRKKAKIQQREMKKMEKHSKEKQKYNWEIFNTSEDLNKLTWKSSVVMTPPRSTQKKRLMSVGCDFLSPLKVKKVKEENEAAFETAKDDKTDDELVKEIREGVFEMMKDDDEDEVRDEVKALLDTLAENTEDDAKSEHEDKLNESLHAVLDAENDPNTPNKKFFPIFSTPKSSCSPLPNVKLSSQKKKMIGLGMDQLQLDVGQDKLREIECSGCGLIYVQGNPEDMAEHEIFHFKFKELHFSGWKNERVVRHDGIGRVICIRNSDCKQWWKKAMSVLEVIDSVLGYPAQGPAPTQIYLYVSNKFIRGVVAISNTAKAHKMLNIDSTDDIGLCSEEEYPVKCLISRIWVDHQFRRCNIATSLLDSVRSNYTFGYILKTSDLAFSSPTDEGRRFIEKYTKTKEYFVYA